MLLPTFYLIFRSPSEKIGNIWMDALELTLKSSHLLKPPTTNYINGSFASSSLNTSISASNSTIITQKTLANTTTVSSNNQNKSSEPHQKMSTLLSVSSLPLQSQCSNINDSTLNINNNRECINLSNGHLNTDDIENKHFKEICFDITEEVVLSDSDAKNSSDDLCSLNSSFNNENPEEDEFFDDNYNEFNNDKAKSKKYLNEIVEDVKGDDQENDNKAIDSEVVKNETKYIQSPSEEFGEVNNYMYLR